MRLLVIMMNFGKVFAGDVQEVGEIVVSSSDDELAGMVVVNSAVAIVGGDLKIAVSSIHNLDPLVLRNRQMIVLGDLAVIFQRLLPGGLLMGGGEGDVANLQQLRSSEEGHIGRVVEKGVDETSLVDDYDFEAGFLGLDAAGQTSGTGADDQHVHTSVGAGIELCPWEGVGDV